MGYESSHRNRLTRAFIGSFLFRAMKNAVQQIDPQYTKALEKAKIALMIQRDTAFFCEIAFSLKYVWTEEVATAATDGVHMYLNPEWFMQWTPEQRIGLILHESLHVAYMHMVRKQSRDHKLYNIAADHVINLVITERGMKIPEGDYCDRKYSGMSSEQVYELLKKEADQNPNSPLNMPGMKGAFGEDLLDPPPGMTAEDVEVAVQQTLIRAHIRSKEENDSPGTIPGDLDLFINGLLNPKLPWQKILQKYLTTFSKTDYSMKKPNRRFFPEYYLPSMNSYSLMDITVAVDISGSVTDHDFKTFISEIAGIFKMMKPRKITLIQFDTSIKSVDELNGFSDLMRVKFIGRGGTDIGELIKWTNDNKPQLLMVFTDGEFHFKNHHTKQNVLWMIHENPKFKPAFGKAIHYDIHKI